MNLTELLVAATVLAISASASLQVWAAGGQWSVRVDQQRQQHIALEAELLAVQAQLQQLAGEPVAADCQAAADWLVARLPALEHAGSGVGLRLQGAGGLERRRWYDPAALGLCGVPGPAEDPVLESK
jgi:type II secretory pathway pseudopilin PulG